MSKNHHSVQFRQMRSICLWLHPPFCCHCKIVKESLHVHHLDHNSANNALVNLLPLCNNCHDLVHLSRPIGQLSNKLIIILLLKKIVQYSGKKSGNHGN